MEAILLIILLTACTAFCTSLWCYGLHATTREGMIFYKPADWMTKRIGTFYSKPLYGCPTCMASVWGSAAYFLFLYGMLGIWGWPIFIMCLAGLNDLISAKVYS